MRPRFRINTYLGNTKLTYRVARNHDDVKGLICLCNDNTEDCIAAPALQKGYELLKWVDRRDTQLSL